MKHAPLGTLRLQKCQDETYPSLRVRCVTMPKNRTEPPDLDTQAGRLVWARSAAGYSSPRAAAKILRWKENSYKAHETGARGKLGIPPEKLELYAKTFKVDITWLAFGMGQPFDGVTDEQLNSYPVARETLSRRLKAV